MFVGVPCERPRCRFNARAGFLGNRFCNPLVECGGVDCDQGHAVLSPSQELGTSRKVLPSRSRSKLLEFVIRFLAGGIVVSAFALLGDLLRPKSVVGLFSAAPSVALVTLGLAFLYQGVDY